MASHPEVILTLSELHNQERLRDAFWDRLAASAEAGACARHLGVRAARRAAVSMATIWLSHVRGTKQVHVTAPLTSNAAPSVQ